MFVMELVLRLTRSFVLFPSDTALNVVALSLRVRALSEFGGSSGCASALVYPASHLHAAIPKLPTGDDAKDGHNEHDEEALLP